MSGDALQALAVAVPLAAAAALWRLRRPDARARAGILLGIGWIFAVLPPLGSLALRQGW